MGQGHARMNVWRCGRHKFAHFCGWEVTCDLMFLVVFTFFFTFSVIVAIDKTSEINYELLQPPIFTSGYLQTDHKVNGDTQSLSIPALLLEDALYRATLGFKKIFQRGWPFCVIVIIINVSIKFGIKEMLPVNKYQINNYVDTSALSVFHDIRKPLLPVGFWGRVIYSLDNHPQNSYRSIPCYAPPTTIFHLPLQTRWWKLTQLSERIWWYCLNAQVFDFRSKMLLNILQ